MDRIKLINDIASKTLGYKVDFSKRKEIIESKRIPTGIVELDRSLGGGIPESYVVVLGGPDETNKSTISFKTVANIQKKYPEKLVLYCDMEGHLDFYMAEEHGVDTDENKFIVAYAPTATELIDMVFNILDEMPGEISAIVIDSIPAMTDPKKVDSKTSSEDIVIAGTAKPTTRLFEVLESYYRKCKLQKCYFPTVLAITQARANLNKVNKYDSDFILSGGYKLKHISYLTLVTGKKKDEEVKGEGIIKKTFKITIQKGKLGTAANKVIDYQMWVTDKYGFKKGSIDDKKVLIGYARDLGLIEGLRKNLKIVNVPVEGIEKQSFNTQGDLEIFLDHNEDITNLLKAIITIDHRKNIGKPALNESEPYFMYSNFGEDVLSAFA